MISRNPVSAAKDRGPTVRRERDTSLPFSQCVCVRRVRQKTLPPAVKGMKIERAFVVAKGSYPAAKILNISPGRTAWEH